MELIKKNKGVITIVLIVVVLVLIRSIGMNHFKSDAKKWAAPSMVKHNTVTRDKLSSLNGNKLIINLDKDNRRISGINGEIMNVAPDSVLERKSVAAILKNDGPVLISSGDPAVSARIWMILSQMGRTNIYILTDSTDGEMLRYKFQPETLSDGNIDK